MLSWGLSRGDDDRRRSSGSRRDDLSLMACTRRPNAPRVRQRAASRAHLRTPARADWMRTTLPRDWNHFRHAIGRIRQRLGGVAPREPPSPWETHVLPGPPHRPAASSPHQRTAPQRGRETTGHGCSPNPIERSFVVECSEQTRGAIISERRELVRISVASDAKRHNPSALGRRRRRRGCLFERRGLHCARRSVRRQRDRASSGHPNSATAPRGDATSHDPANDRARRAAAGADARRAGSDPETAGARSPICCWRPAR